MINVKLKKQKENKFIKDGIYKSLWKKIYLYIDPQEKISTFKTFRHKPSSVIITDEGLCRNVLKVGIFS